MLEKNSKISVLRTMIGLGEDIEPQFIVPQNSVMNMRQKLGLTEQVSNASRTVTPMDSAYRSNQPSVQKCPHCENMAKNFLYLESLIRSNFNVKDQCSLCYSSLKYLQYVNKSIAQVFGNINSIVQSAQTATVPNKHFKLGKSRSRSSKLHSASHTAYSATVSKPATTKHTLPKKKSKISKLSSKRSKHSNKSNSGLRLSRSKSRKTRSKNSLKKSPKKKQHLNGIITEHNSRTAEGAFENGSKFSKGKSRVKSAANKLRAIKSKSAALMRGFKQKSLKSKRTKLTMLRT